MNDTTTINYSKESPKDLMKQTQLQVDELLEISRNNAGKLMERGQKLSDLTEISKNLEKGAGEFKTQAETVKRQQCMKNLKKKILIFSILFFLLLFVILISFSNK